MSIIKLFKQDDDGKTMFHIACMRGNKELINTCLATHSEHIYIADMYGNTGAHYLALSHYDDILLNVVKKYSYFLKLKNNEPKYIFHIVLRRTNTLKKILKIMINNNYHKYIEEDIILKIIYNIKHNQSKYFNILLFLNKHNISFNKPLENPSILNAIIYNREFAIFMIDNIKNLDLNMTNKDNLSPLIEAIYKKDTEICIKLIQKKCDINYGGFNKEFVPASYALEIGNELYDVVEEITKRDDFDYNNLNYKLNTPIYYLIDCVINNSEKYQKNIKLVDNLMKKFIINSNLSNLNRLNITPLHLLLKYNLWIDFKRELLNKEFDINILDIYRATPLSLVDKTHFDEFIQFLDLKLKNNSPTILKINTSIILPETEYTNNSVWNIYSPSQIAYMTYFLEKYNNIIIPFQSHEKNKQKFDEYNLEIMINNPNIAQIIDAYGFYVSNFYSLSPYFFCWMNKHIYIYNNNLKFLIRKSLATQKRFIYLYCLIVQDNFNHANSILYDKQTNTLMRFEPYGDVEWYDGNDLDNTLKELFEKALKKKVEYFKPIQYLANTKFQVISEEHNTDYTRLNDPAGFCMAWSFWFIELKMLNPNVSNNELFSLALKKIILLFDENVKNPILSYIRNYANYLDKHKNNIFNKAGINKEDYYIKHMPISNMNKLYNYSISLIETKIF